MKRIKSIAKRIRVLVFTFLGLTRAPFLKSKFEIKRGYFHRKKYTHFSDTNNSEEWQKEVYEEAEHIARINNYKKIIDVGCGSGYKLIKYFGKNYDTVGIEVEDTYSYLVKKYPNYKWLNVKSIDYSTLKADMVITSDVIEHVIDPTKFLDNVKKIRDVKFIVISTPDRSLLKNSFGPPFNKTHMREWTGEEFQRYLISQNLKIISHQISNYSQATQLTICKK